MTRFTLMTRLTFLVVGVLFLVVVAARGQFLMMNVSGPSDGGSGGACSAGQFDFSDSCNTVLFTGAMRP